MFDQATVTIPRPPGRQGPFALPMMKQLQRQLGYAFRAAITLALLSSPLAAQQLGVTASLDRDQIRTGETFELRADFSNFERYDSLSFTLGAVPSGFFFSLGRLESFTGEGWSCEFPLPGSGALHCSIRKASFGAVIPSLRLQLGAPSYASDQPIAMVFDVHVSGKTGDAVTAPVRTEVRFTIIPRKERADVRLDSAEEIVERFDQSSIARVKATVTNTGPDATGELRLALSATIDYQSVSPLPKFSVLTPAWICEVKGRTLQCASGSLAPSESRPFELAFTTPATRGQFEFSLHVSPLGAGDPTLSNNLTFPSFVVLSSNKVEPVLFPIASFDSGGAFQSAWRAEATAASSAQGGGFLFPQLYNCQIQCDRRPALGYAIQPDRSVAVGFLSAQGGGPGRVLYSSPEELTDLHFQHRVYDVSRRANNYGTELPVIRKKELITRDAHLLNIPTDNRFRSTMRIYDPANKPGARVRIRYYSMVSDTLLHESEHTLEQAAPIGYPELDLPARPAYLQLDSLTTLFPALSQVERFRVEIEPLTPGLRYWAFVSITNNETQHVTTVTPQ